MHRHLLRPTSLSSLLAIVAMTAGCAATITSETLESRTSQAIGRQVGSFTISDRNEEAGGRINYVAQSRDGSRWQCSLYSPTGFQKAMTFGMTPDSDALCTQMSGGPSTGSANRPNHATSPSANCNALLRAAGRCQ